MSHCNLCHETFSDPVAHWTHLCGRSWRPRGARLLVRRAALPETSKGGLMVLGREYPTIATVIAVGPGTRTRDGVRHPITDVREGDEVTFDKFAIETRMVPGSEDLAILDYADCWLRIRREM